MEGPGCAIYVLLINLSIHFGFNRIEAGSQGMNEVQEVKHTFHIIPPKCLSSTGIPLLYGVLPRIPHFSHQQKRKNASEARLQIPSGAW